MTTRIVHGNINSDGKIETSSKDFSVTRTDTGIYQIKFREEFKAIPSIVGSQTRSESSGQKTLDGVIFPFVSETSATVYTGDSLGNRSNRSFSFIAIGE